MKVTGLWSWVRGDNWKYPGHSEKEEQVAEKMGGSSGVEERSRVTEEEEVLDALFSNHEDQRTAAQRYLFEGGAIHQGGEGIWRCGWGQQEWGGGFSGSGAVETELCCGSGKVEVSGVL